VRVAVAKGSAYDLFLTRTLKQAEVVRAISGPQSQQLFVKDNLEVLAGIRKPLSQFVEMTPGYRVLPGRFMAIEQAMCVPKGRDAGARYLRAFVEEMKATGMVAKALAESGQGDVLVAPPAP
jgi:polar amino acid transport system substrate-binding protein